ncbi:citrate lyase acyl carrier protein [Tetragenococcus osmophilus]|uniref:Citrate lyase acyl carrier protein n=1 Tax=Tetragenococcus osmophilus TaxID=526944 RepID=A0AA37XKE2_9ENTE|nr:citrate lyase acyl carrier protein [Tetragenococcus osmophilus]AYW48228.1 citrate lyase acyl carrier protein [Tetragenococcus osmophilus]GMA54011.1 citrate lyase acyl carrier protein [Alicyclobacillus contaminans]GMA72093.1 citrate lyase acyl carrier protein [Tetragenococcus osmophilus]
MELLQNAVSGTLESSDIQITIQPVDNAEIQIDLDSSVEKQFGRKIRQVITDTLQRLDAQGVKVTAVDKGALDCTIQARTITAVHRAAKQEQYDWKEIDSWND